MSLASLPSDCILTVLSSVAVRDCLSLGCSSQYFYNLIKEDSLWKALAEKKWGPWVAQLADVEAGCWKQYCVHRTNFESLPTSPLDLIQEQYPDPWQHLACCILCSRTTGGRAVRQAITALLDALPTPSAVLDASKETLWTMLHPLGLQAVRYAALKEMSHDFLAKAWEDPQEFKGCGKFTADSWRIFCRGHRSLGGVEDATLLCYLRWLTRGVVVEKKGKGGSKAAAGAKRKREDVSKAVPSGGGRRLRSSGRPQGTPDASDRRVTRSTSRGGR